MDNEYLRTTSDGTQVIFRTLDKNLVAENDMLGMLPKLEFSKM